MTQSALSFVVPAFNEEDSIEVTLGTLEEIVKSNSLSYEIIVVNDGSRDKTLSKAVKYARRNGHVRVVNYTQNQGKGFAVRMGFMQSKGKVVIFADSDMEIDLKLISRYVEALKQGDIVIASKWHPDSVVEMPIIRRLCSHSFNMLVRLLTGVHLKDTQAGLKAIRKSAFLDIFLSLSVKRYAFDVELLTVAKLYGLKVVEMPVKLKMGASFKIREMWKMLVDVLGVAYRLRVKRYYQKFRSTR